MLGFADRLAVCAPIGLGLGRVANFVNGELWGRTAPTWWPGAMIFPQAGPPDVPRFPSELYGAFLEGIVLFAIMLLLLRSERVRGRYGYLTGVFILGYGVSRIIAECFRQPDAFLGYFAGVLTMGQILSFPMVAIGGGLIWWSGRRRSGGDPGPGIGGHTGSAAVPVVNGADHDEANETEDRHGAESEDCESSAGRP